MEFCNDGTSVYHRLAGLVLFDSSGVLLYVTGPEEQWISAHWSSCVPLLLTLQNRQSSSSASETTSTLKDGARSLSLHCGQQLPDGNTAGIIIDCSTSRPEGKTFDELFAQLILKQTAFALHHPTTTALPSADAIASAEAITSLFDSYLRYQGKDDKWSASGSAYFLERTKRFTTSKARIELCLPAFPCKSSNLNKVTGKSPDRGEWLALERLHGFVEAVEKIYAPGALVWIISDGHVFSDCIGVDDADVDRYGEELAEMNRAIGIARGRTNRVQFRSLVDFFGLHEEVPELSGEHKVSYAAMAKRLNIPGIAHHIPTSVTEEAELCRQILMAGCQPKRTKVRAEIDSGDAAILALYRGFSRFMLEDLELHPFTRGLSKSKRKKLSCQVAFEMILRNQAYSNLVEMLFPHHLRLSIHAHNNAGPKFGIQLFDPASVRATTSLSPDGAAMESLDLLHIPTPWHNSIVRLGHRHIVTKSQTARDAVASGTLAGGLVQGKPDQQGGACFELRDPVSTPTMTSFSDVEVLSAAKGKMKEPAIEVVEIVEKERPGSMVDSVKEQAVHDNVPMESWWPVYLRRLATLWFWSKSSSYTVANNPYHQHESQTMGT